VVRSTPANNFPEIFKQGQKFLLFIAAAQNVLFRTSEHVGKKAGGFSHLTRARRGDTSQLD